MISKYYEVFNPNTICDPLVSKLDKDYGRVEDFCGYENVFIYHICDSTVILTYNYDEYDRPPNFFCLALASSKSEALDSVSKLLMEEIKRINPDYDISQIKEGKR